MHISCLWAEGEVEGVNMVTAVGLQEAGHTEQQKEGGLEGQGGSHHTPHPSTWLPTAADVLTF